MAIAYRSVLASGGMHIDSLTITSQPTKTSYLKGQTLDTTGLVVTASAQGMSGDVTQYCTITPTVLSTAGTQAITVSYGDATATFNVTVAQADTLTITTPPTKTSYKPNEQLDLTGIVVTASASGAGLSEDVTADCTFSPADGTVLTTEGTFTLTASYDGLTATTTYKVATLEMVAWSTGTDAQIKAMIDAYYAGDITLNDIKQYWNIGDERTVALSAMAATGVGESHISQNVTMVIMNWGGKKLASDGTTDVLAVVGQKDLLNDGSSREGGYMNSTNTNTGGWKSCARRSWCNDVYRAAITSQTMRDCFKQFINQSGTGGGSSSGVENTSDYFAMAAEIEVFGTASYSVAGEGTQFKYYETADNRKKYATSGGSAGGWWERSPYSGISDYFCSVNGSGGAGFNTANTAFGLAPFGCI